jgi:hypothetical protein
MRLLPVNSLTIIFAATPWIHTAHTKPTKAFSTPESLHQRYDYGIDKRTLIKRSTEHIVTTGIHVGQGPGGSLPQRLEVRDLEQDKMMWTLYILGLDMLQWTPQSDKLSWYQIMGQSERYSCEWLGLRSVQESTVDRFFPTMAPSLYLEEKGTDTAHMFQYCFPFGIDLTLSYTRSVKVFSGLGRIC